MSNYNNTRTKQVSSIQIVCRYAKKHFYVIRNYGIFLINNKQLSDVFVWNITERRDKSEIHMFLY